MSPIILAACLILAFGLVQSQTGGISPFEVQIESEVDVLPGHLVQLDIHVNQISSEISGFDFRIGYNAGAFSLRDVTPGNFVNEDDWEYFTFRYYLRDSSETSYPSGLARIVALAEFGGIGPQLKLAIDSGETIATMHFLVSNDRDLECTEHGIEFFWTGCGDNKIYSENGDTIFISRDVYSWDDSLLTLDTLMPSNHGAPSVCLTSLPPDYDKAVVRGIDFVNGRVKIICADSIDAQGCWGGGWYDGYIWGYMILLRYILTGSTDYFPFEDWLEKCTDLNGDGMPATIEDLQFLARIIVGDAIMSTDTVLEGTVVLSNVGDGLSARVITDDTLGLFLFRFLAPDTITAVIQSLEIKDMEMRYLQFHDTLSIIVFSLGRQAVGPGTKDLFQIQTSGSLPQITYCDAAGYYGEKVDLALVTPDSIDARGDCNLNGIPFEIGDIRLLIDSYRAGSHDILQLPWPPEDEDFYTCYDLDGDGFSPSLCDFQILLRNYTDDAKPLNEIDTAYGGKIRVFEDYFGNQSSQVLVSADGPIGSAYLRFHCTDPNVEVTMDSTYSPLQMAYQRSNNSLNVLFYSLDSGVNIAPGGYLHLNLKTHGFATPILHWTAAGYFGEKINLGMNYGETDCRGDLNVNGVAFDEDDYSTFAQYFIYGTDAFSYPPFEQLCSDLNGDGLTLTLRDFQYMSRIITGDVRNDLLNASFLSNVSVMTGPKFAHVKLEPQDTIGSLCLKFLTTDSSASVFFDTTTMNMSTSYHWANDTLRVFIYGLEGKMLPGQFPTFVVTTNRGNPQLISLEAAGYYGERVDLEVRIFTDVNETIDENLPASYSLSQNYPNPFNSSTEIRFALPARTEWELEIFNITGQVVRRFSGDDASGSVQVFWDGRNYQGEAVSSAVYLYRLKAGEYYSNRKMMLLK